MIEPRLGLSLMALCVIAFILVERERQRKIASLRPTKDEDGAPEPPTSSDLAG